MIGLFTLDVVLFIALFTIAVVVVNEIVIPLWQSKRIFPSIRQRRLNRILSEAKEDKETDKIINEINETIKGE